MCVCSFLISSVCFSSTYFKVLCRSLQKKSDRTRCLAVSILEYNLGGTVLTGIRSRQSERKRFGFLKEERNSVMIHR